MSTTRLSQTKVQFQNYEIVTEMRDSHINLTN